MFCKSYDSFAFFNELPPPDSRQWGLELRSLVRNAFRPHCCLCQGALAELIGGEGRRTIVLTIAAWSRDGSRRTDRWRREKNPKDSRRPLELRLLHLFGRHYVVCNF